MAGAEHILKTTEPYFTAIGLGDKTFELRRNDRAYQKGDTVVLYQYVPERCRCSDPNCDRRATPIKKQITFVFAGDPSLGVDLGGIHPGYVILGLGPVEEES